MFDREKMLESIKAAAKCSLLYWWPKVKGLGIPVPRTEIVEIPHEVFLKFLDTPEALDPYLDDIYKAAKRIGYPLFLRTDLISGKHEWERTCYVPDEESLLSHIYAVVEEHFLAQIIPLPCRALVFREFLELDWAFKAFRGMPIARERRYFIKDGKVLCHHPYWPEDAIWNPDRPNWRELLAELNRETEDEVRLLTSYALKIASVMDGYWSVDFAHARNGKWYLIDMAVGEFSWHPPGCPYAKSVTMPDGGSPDADKIQARCDVCGRLVTAEVIRKELDDHGHEIWIAKCPECGCEFQAACIGRESSEYVVLLAGQEGLAESFKQIHKLLQHVRYVLGEVEARLRELEGELGTPGNLGQEHVDQPGSVCLCAHGSPQPTSPSHAST